jgi:hypothetical protein
MLTFTSSACAADLFNFPVVLGHVTYLFITTLIRRLEISCSFCDYSLLKCSAIESFYKNRIKKNVT